MDWAEPGQTAIFFVNGSNFVACLGRSWYQGHLHQSPWWTMTSGRPELSLAYFGSTEKLKQHVADILDGKEVVIGGCKPGVSCYSDGSLLRPERWVAASSICSVAAPIISARRPFLH